MVGDVSEVEGIASAQAEQGKPPLLRWNTDSRRNSARAGGDGECQRKVEMSGLLPDRNVRFQGFLQGWSGGGMCWGLILVGGFGFPSASPGGRRLEGLADRSGATGQATSGR